MGQLKNSIESLKYSILREVKANANLLTAFAALLVFVVGASIVNNNDNWWMAVVAIGVFFLIIFLLINARVIIKSGIFFVSLIILSALALQVGFFIDPKGISGVSWMGATISIPLFMLGLTYILPSAKGRWGTLTASVFSSFAVTYVLMMSLITPSVSIVIGTVVAILIFSLSYYMFGKTRYNKERMPQPKLTKNILNNLSTGLIDDGWNVSVLNRDEEIDDGDLLVWNDKRAYLLHPVSMDNEFTLVGETKNPSLGYGGKSINPWLMNMILKRTPSLRSRGAFIMPVIIDNRGANGNEIKMIGASLPDTSKRFPVMITPSYDAIRNVKKVSYLMESIQRESRDYGVDLTPRQLKSLSKFSRVDV